MYNKILNATPKNNMLIRKKMFSLLKLMAENNRVSSIQKLNEGGVPMLEAHIINQKKENQGAKFIAFLLNRKRRLLEEL